MKIIKLKSLSPQYTNVVLFTETSKDDYLYNHQLSLISDTDDNADIVHSRSYDMLPDEALVSDRSCIFKSVSVKPGVMYR